MIYGDYDCDGITATAILWLTLHHLGLNAWPFLPHRQRHGYGLSLKGLEEIWHSAQPTLVITVDNGIVAHEGIDWLKNHGAEVIVTDHHESGPILPPADTIVHSTKLCGATVAWLLAHELDPVFANQQLDLSAIGTIADQVPLYGANRSFAVHGLKLLRKNTRTSLAVLAETSGLKLEQANASTVHFGIAPRLNAMGRLYEAKDALRALVSSSPARAQEMMRRLHEVNIERQVLTQQSLDEVFQKLPDYEQESIVIASGQFHEGIVGLIAGKLVEQTGKPSIALSLNGSVAKASCRSVEGFHMTDFLRGLSAIPYLSLGGHAMAAGFSLPVEHASEAMKLISQSGREKIPPGVLDPTLPVLGELTAQLLNKESAKLIQQFEPFGAGNSEPVFVLPHCKILEIRPVGKGKKHAQLRLAYQGATHQAIWFGYQERGWHEKLETGDFAVTIRESSFRGREIEIQIELVNARS